jgi:hypothetical protein
MRPLAGSARGWLVLGLVTALSGVASASEDVSVCQAPPFISGVHACAETETGDRIGAFCDAYNPRAVANACLEADRRGLALPETRVEPSEGPCILGNECLPSPHASPPREGPWSGYAETTAACMITPQCRVALP